jgi:hypothetical protein
LEANQDQANAGLHQSGAGLSNNQKSNKNCDGHGGVRSMSKYMVLQKREIEKKKIWTRLAVIKREIAIKKADLVDTQIETWCWF